MPWRKSVRNGIRMPEHQYRRRRPALESAWRSFLSLCDPAALPGRPGHPADGRSEKTRPPSTNGGTRRDPPYLSIEAIVLLFLHSEWRKGPSIISSRLRSAAASCTRRRNPSHERPLRQIVRLRWDGLDGWPLFAPLACAAGQQPVEKRGLAPTGSEQQSKHCGNQPARLIYNTNSSNLRGARRILRRRNISPLPNVVC